MIVRALTLKQPWASAVVFGPKRIENRTWRGPVGERIAIHAGAAWDAAGESLCFDSGHAICRDPFDRGPWRCPNCRYTGNGAQEFCPKCPGRVFVGHTPDGLRRDRTRKAIIGTAIVHAVVPVETTASWITDTQRPWAIGPWCWCLSDVRRIDPIPMRGRLGLWRVPDEAVAELVRQGAV